MSDDKAKPPMTPEAVEGYAERNEISVTESRELIFTTDTREELDWALGQLKRL